MLRHWLAAGPVPDRYRPGGRLTVTFTLDVETLLNAPPMASVSVNERVQ